MPYNQPMLLPISVRWFPFIWIVIEKVSGTMNYATQSVSSGWLSQRRYLKTESVVKSLMWWFTQEVTSVKWRVGESGPRKGNQGTRCENKWQRRGSSHLAGTQSWRHFWGVHSPLTFGLFCLGMLQHVPAKSGKSGRKQRRATQALGNYCQWRGTLSPLQDNFI